MNITVDTCAVWIRFSTISFTLLNKFIPPWNVSWILITVLLYVMNWFKITICDYFSYQCLNFIWFALTVSYVLLWCYQQNYYNLWRVHISSTNTSAPTSLLQSINANLMMNTENQSQLKANYHVFKWQTITVFPGP
jgi:hypothetical protein